MKVGTALRRGLTKRCAVCGGGRLFQGWFRMKPTCPTCGTTFEREAGFFSGAVFVNFAFTEVVMFLYLAIAAFVMLPHPRLDVLLIGSAAICVVLPVILYPFSKTTWFAVHLLMEPLESGR